MKPINLKENSYFHMDGTHGVSFDTKFGKVSITARSRAFRVKFAEGKSDVVEVRIMRDGMVSCYRKVATNSGMARQIVNHVSETAGQGRLDSFLMELKRIGFQSVAYTKRDWEEDAVSRGAVGMWSFSHGGDDIGIRCRPIGAMPGRFFG